MLHDESARSRAVPMLANVQAEPARRELARTRCGLAKVYASLSWQVTRPLRPPCGCSHGGRDGEIRPANRIRGAGCSAATPCRRISRSRREARHKGAPKLSATAVPWRRSV